MKILDAPSLLSAVEQRSKAYHELQEEMKLVKKALKSVSVLVASDLKYGEVKRNQYAQSNSGKPNRLLDDDGGHLIASIFKGSRDIDNLVPMNSQINRSGGKWYEMEQKWRKALASDPPKRVEVIIEPKYLNDSIRPSEFGVFYSIEGKEKYLIIENKIGG